MGKKALVLSGGTAKGAYQVGMLSGLVEKCPDLDFDVIRGVSVGALNGAFLAQYESGAAQFREAVKELEKIWTGIEGNDDVYSKRLLGIPGLALGANSLHRIGGLRRLIKDHLCLKCLQASKRDFRVGTVSLVSGEYKEWCPNTDDFVEN